MKNALRSVERKLKKKQTKIKENNKLNQKRKKIGKRHQERRGNGQVMEYFHM